MADGTEILFSREYVPMFERLPDGVVTRADPGRWYEWDLQSWFYDDDTIPFRDKATRARLMAILQSWGIT